MNEKQASRLFWAVKALLVGLLLYVAVEAVTTPLHLRKTLKPHAVAGGEHTPALPPVEPEPAPPADVSAILENNLFAGANSIETPDPATKNGVSAPARSARDGELGLRLVGTIAGGDTISRALIEDTTAKNTQLYKIGDVVASATVESIGVDTVTLRHNGRKKILRRHTTTSASGSPAGQPKQAQEAQNAGPKPVDSSENTDLRPPSAKLGYVENIFRQATIEPHVVDGQAQGLKITGLENTPLAGMFGLRNGDIVQAVNGQHLTSKQKAFQVLQKARNQSRIHIQLLRNDQAKDLSFDL